MNMIGLYQAIIGKLRKLSEPWLRQQISGSCRKVRIIESMMGFRPRQGNLRLVFRLFSLMRGLLSIRLNNLQTSLRFPCRDLNLMIGYFSHPLYFSKQNIH